MKRLPIIAAAVAFSSGAASAQQPCGGTADALAMLAQDWGEHVTASGLAGGALVQVLANPETGTWTIIVSGPDGMSCMVASGTDWNDFPARPNL